MNEIKLRAWNGKEMSKPFTIWDIERDESYRHYLGSYKAYGDENIMQYTGLKDKNGVEIYESDYIRGLDGQNNYIEGQIIFKTNWGRIIIGETGLSLTYQLAQRNKVIGNIYEDSIKEG